MLGIETSGSGGSVAACDAGRLLAELPLNAAQRGAQALAPALAELLRAAGWRPADVGLVAVAIGPGSFTSLRVGVTTAKTFAYAVSAPVIGIGTLEAIAHHAGAAAGSSVAAAIDAQRGDVYASRFRIGSAFAHTVLEPPAIHRADDWLAGLLSATLATGPALEKLSERLPSGIAIAPSDLWQATASTIACLAAAKYAGGERSDVWGLAPLYLRKSAAEERAR